MNPSIQTLRVNFQTVDSQEIHRVMRLMTRVSKSTCHNSMARISHLLGHHKVEDLYDYREQYIGSYSVPPDREDYTIFIDQKGNFRISNYDSYMLTLR